MTGTDRDPGVEEYRTEYELEDADDLCRAILRSVGTITGEEPTGLGPPYDSIDPDALQDLVRSFRDPGGSVAGGSVEFVFDTCRVRVRADGLLELRHPAGGWTERSHRDTALPQEHSIRCGGLQVG